MLLAREDNVPRLIVHEFASGEAREIAFEAQTYFLRLETVYEFDSPMFRFSFSSMAAAKSLRLRRQRRAAHPASRSR